MIDIFEHIKTDGERCGSPAVNNTSFCHFQRRFHDLNDMPGAPTISFPSRTFGRGGGSA
ncbi:MAG: hypothetical protein ACXVZV_04700 [Terriglobales bacterium]